MSQLSLFIWLSVTFGVIPPIFNSTRVDGINADDLWQALVLSCHRDGGSQASEQEDGRE